MKGSFNLLRSSYERSGARGPTPRGEYALCCPFCAQRGNAVDEKYKLSANPTKNLWHCFRCGAKGRGCLAFLGASEDVAPSPAPSTDMGPPEHFVPLTERAQVLAPYRAYLEKRCVLAPALHVGAGACLRGRYAGRVVIPMRGADGAWSGFSARSLANRDPKYLYPAGMDRKSNLWGAEWIARLKDKAAPVWLVEGVFDALPLFPWALAAYGKEVTDGQIDLLLSMRRPVVACLDGDAWVEARSMALRLSMRGISASWCRLPPATDPGKLGWHVRDYVIAEKSDNPAL